MTKSWGSFCNNTSILKRCDNLDAVENICDQFFKSLNIYNFHYAWTSSSIVSTADIVINRVNWHWVKHCDKYNLAKIQNSPFTQQPLEWNLDAKHIHNHKRNIIIDGCIIPIKGNASLYLYYRKTTAIHHKMLPLLENWAIYLQNRLEYIHANMYVGSPLTSREKEILSLTSIGKIVQEISLIINIETTTVNFRLTNLRKKFNVYNKQHLIAKAVALNFENSIATQSRNAH